MIMAMQSLNLCSRNAVGLSMIMTRVFVPRVVVTSMVMALVIVMMCMPVIMPMTMMIVIAFCRRWRVCFGRQRHERVAESCHFICNRREIAGCIVMQDHRAGGDRNGYIFNARHPAHRCIDF